ncbi:MAG TPA: hypothetical protein VJR95_10375 [Rhodanobacter sp.]|nr:hypothetical protein [Rhodanobacter sp.]
MQTAGPVLERGCRCAIAFEGSYMARQHEVDIRLLERTAATLADVAACITTLRVAARWAEAMELRRGRQTGG